ncbi:MAG TPA: ATP-binding protein [bacterium]|nr:ATP-binding protein [bacterium]HPN32645.1 ATP-binding protein [bacterium]
MKEKIKHIIVEWQETLKNLSKPIFPRSIELRFTNEINTVIGLRRSGKTYLLFTEIQKLLAAEININQILYINFDDERFLQLNSGNYDYIIEAYFELYPENIKNKVYIFFDEIQNLEAWDLFIKRLYEKKKFKITITGSSSRLLSAEIATELRGRTITYKIHTLGFKEFLKFKGIDIEKNSEYSEARFGIAKKTDEFIQFGGFPAVAMESDLRLKNERLKDYLDMVVFKDIVDRYSIRNTHIVKLIMHYVVRNYASEFSVNSFINKYKKEYSLSKDTVFNYFSYLEDIGFIYFAGKYSLKIAEQYISKKVYVADNGFINISEFNENENAGRKLENTVYLELLKTGKSVFYYKTENGKECDFVTGNNTKIDNAYQVCYELNKNNESREITGLIEALKRFKLKKGYIITKSQDEIKKIENFTIICLPFWKWAIKIEGNNN